MTNFRFDLAGGAKLDLQCGERVDTVSMRITGEEPKARGGTQVSMLFHQQRLDPVGYRVLRSGDGVEALARALVEQHGGRFGEVLGASAPAAASSPSDGSRSRQRGRRGRTPRLQTPPTES